jgi:hypothetical protein
MVAQDLGSHLSLISLAISLLLFTFCSCHAGLGVAHRYQAFLASGPLYLLSFTIMLFLLDTCIFSPFPSLVLSLNIFFAVERLKIANFYFL